MDPKFTRRETHWIRRETRNTEKLLCAGATKD
jgi:hypothetical protein